MAVKRKPGSRIVPDDISVGAFLVIREFCEPQRTFLEDEYDKYLQQYSRTEKKWLVGLPLKVVAISLPFVAVRTPPITDRYSVSGPIARVVSIDTREVFLMTAGRGMWGAFDAKQ